MTINYQRVEFIKRKLEEILNRIREIDCELSLGTSKNTVIKKDQQGEEVPEHPSLLFKLNPISKNLINRCMNIFFFYQGDIESLLSNHDYGFC